MIQDDEAEIGVRIGELSRRVGVSPDVLRAWERRYGVLSPRRSTAGQRLYSAADEQRVRAMQESITRGYSPRVAARLAIGRVDGDGGGAHAGRGERLPAAELDELAATLRASLFALEDARANRALDELLAGHGTEAVLTRVLLPLLREIGDRWARNELTVGQEHFASGLLVGRLRGLTPGWDAGGGPRVLAACPAGEAHDLGLLCFCVLLRERKLAITYLGASVPSDSLFDAAERVRPAVAVMAAVREEPFWDSYEALAELAFRYPVMLGGAGATAPLADMVGARLLPQDPVAAADMVAGAALAAAARPI